MSFFHGRYFETEKPIKNRALLVIDVQNEYFTGKLPVSYPLNTLDNILNVIDISRKSKIPIVIIQHTMEILGANAFIKGSYGWDLVNELKNIKADYYIEKNFPSAFVSTDLEIWLNNNNIDTVSIIGYMTQCCCDTTAKYSMHLGYNVEFLSDATGTLGFENTAGKVTAEELHRSILVQQQARFSHVLTTKEWVNEIYR